MSKWLNFFKKEKQEVVKPQYNVGKTTLIIYNHEDMVLIKRQFIGEPHYMTSKRAAEAYLRVMFYDGFFEVKENNYIPSINIHRAEMINEDYIVES